MSVPGISSFFEPHLPILEKYWLSSDRKLFVDTLTNQTDKQLLTLLLDPLPQNYN